MPKVLKFLFSMKKKFIIFTSIEGEINLIYINRNFSRENIIFILIIKKIR